MRFSTGAVESILEGHSDAVRSVVLTYLGRFAVTASDDHTVRVWDMRSASLKKVDMHFGKVKQVKRFRTTCSYLKVCIQHFIVPSNGDEFLQTTLIGLPPPLN